MNTTIPKRIIQIWGGGKEMPLLGKASLANVKLLNPDFEYILFDDHLINDFIETEFPEFRSLFYEFPYPIQRYDFLRYLIIYRMGGFYFDLDIILASNLTGLLSFECVFPFERLTWTDFLREQYGMDWEIGNYAFGAAPNHPFIKAVIDNCVRSQSDKQWQSAIVKPLPKLLRDDLYVIYSTGPGLVSRTLAEYKNPGFKVDILFPDNVYDRNNWNRFGDYGLHLAASTWRKKYGTWHRRILGFLGRRNEDRAISLAKEMGQTRTYPLNQREQTPIELESQQQ